MEEGKGATTPVCVFWVLGARRVELRLRLDLTLLFVRESERLRQQRFWEGRHEYLCGAIMLAESA